MSASAAGTSRPGAACSIRRAWRRRRSCLRGDAPDLDRDQFDLLRLAEAGELPQVGARDARRVHFLGEGLALHHQSPRARGGRRLHPAFPQFRRASSSATGSAPCSGSSRRSRNSTRRTSAPFSSCCPRSTRAAACATSIEVRHDSFLVPGIRRAAAQVQHGAGVLRARDLSGDRRHHRRFRLSAPAEGRGHDQDRLSAEGARRLGEAAARCSRKATCRRTCRRSIRRRPRRRRRATCSPT